MKGKFHEGIITTGQRMILPEAGFAVAEDDEGLFFHSPDVNLDEDSLVMPIDCGDGIGTIEFHRRHVMIHPPNGESKNLSIKEFIKMVEMGSSDYEPL